MTQLTVRAVQARDVEFIADIHAAAFPGSSLTKLGREAVRRYYAWQLETAEELHAFAAWHGERPCGFCFGGIFPVAISGYVRAHRNFLAGRLLRKPWLVAEPMFREKLARGISLLRRGTPLPCGSGAPEARPAVKRPFDILAIAVHPQFQGKGVGKRLMEHAVQLACDNGFGVMTLNVARTNVAAIGFYESLGWIKMPPGERWYGRMECWLRERPARL